MMYNYLVVGSGLYGAIFAHEAKKSGKTVLVVDKRPNIAGNVYTEKTEGINVHKYGAHIFHTNNKKVWNYITQFAEFNRFTNSPVANYKGELYSLPFNMYTFNKMWGVVTPEEAAAKIEEQRKEAGITEPKNLEEQAISLVGRDIYEKLIKGYTEKQWGRDCKDLPSFIIKRLPVRLTFDNNYFNALYQGIPMGGYTKMVANMLDGVEVKLGVDYLAEKEAYDAMAEKVICDDFGHAIKELKIQESDYICIVTRGHRHDADCLRMIGKGKEPAYLGMIGSRRRVGIVKQELLEEGYDPERMSRLKSPIGLKIGGVTPEEIAISILAEIIQIKRMDREDKRVKNRSDLDFDVLKRLAEEPDEPKAVVTVIESKGSSPRGAGAKMIVYRDGRILGSIGGGCSEAAVLGEARSLIGSGRYKVVHVDLTGEAAEDEGMVCGGIMDVLVEDFAMDREPCDR